MATNALPYTLTNESITVIYEGKPYVVQKGSPHFIPLRKAILAERWKDVPKNLTIAKSINTWAKGKFTIQGETFLYEGQPVTESLNQRIVQMAKAGEDPTPLFKFWERLQKNPSMRSVEQLWPFMQHEGIPLTKEGCLLTYKGVKHDFKDAHTGTISNKPGTTHEMPRNKISDDPREACHFGFHVGALAYAQGFSDRVVICEVDPENVVCVPYDHSNQKMRICKYRVIGLHNGVPLASTTHEEETTTQLSPGVEEPDNYDPENDFLANPCEECGCKIPPDLAQEDNLYHDVTCSLHNPDYPPVEKRPKSSAPKAPVKKVTGRDKKKAHKAKKKEAKKMIAGFEKLNKMDSAALFEQSLDTLRTYAGKGLKVIGASKIPGGKTALIATILEARR